MKKVVVLLVLAFMASSIVVTAQTRKQKKQLKVLRKEIRTTENDIEYYREGLFFYKKRRNHDSTEVVEMENLLKVLKERLGTLSTRYNKIVDQITDPESGVPVELTNVGHDRRMRSLSVKQQELYYEKAKIIISGDSVRNRTLGYKGIVYNAYYKDVVLKINPVNGGEAKSIYINPGQKLYVDLLPGSYVVYLTRGSQKSEEEHLNVPTPGANFNGEDTSWFILIPVSR